jgi:RimJ/RimL family protein N-acetyltransferase
VIRTARLTLVPATPAALRAALAGREALSDVLGVRVPEDWPPLFLDDDALRYTIDVLARGPEQEGWWMYFVIRGGELVPQGDSRTSPSGDSLLVGSCGYKGPPGGDGVVEIGYGIVASEQRKGYATELANALVAHAFEERAVERVIAETLPALTGSIGVLRKCGFTPAATSSAPGVLCFEKFRG